MIEVLSNNKVCEDCECRRIFNLLKGQSGFIVTSRPSATAPGLSRIIFSSQEVKSCSFSKEGWEGEVLLVDWDNPWQSLFTKSHREKKGQDDIKWRRRREGGKEHYYMDISEKGGGRGRGLKIMCMGLLTRPRDGPIYAKLLLAAQEIEKKR